MSILDVENLSFSFGDKVIINNTSFNLFKGEHAGLIGVNGAGKTTLFNIITGKLIQDEGSISILSSSKIGYLEQNADVDGSLTINQILHSAYNNLYSIEKRIINIGEKLASSCNDYNKLLKRLGALQDTLDASEFYSIEKNIETMSDGLGITALGMNTPFNKLSGGQRTKVLLAKLLLEKPDLLLLDEPTNYLDKNHIEWLTKYLISYKNAFIVISHQLDFINKITNVILNLEFQKIKRYNGNYEAFLKLQDAEAKRYITEYEAQQREIKKLEDYINKNKVRAATAKMAKGREKALSKIKRLEKPKIVSPKPSFNFPLIRLSGNEVLTTKNLAIGYNYPLIRNLNYSITRGDKIVITGCNGIGKSTFLKTVMGIIKPLSGEIQLGNYLYPAYYEQQTSSSELTPLEYVWNEFPKKNQSEIRAALGRCGIKSEHINQKMKTLSGGEQSKVRLCILTLIKSNLLILDEPTNHLDEISKDELKAALIHFPGTILLVCHEEKFYNGIINKVWNLEEKLA